MAIQTPEDGADTGSDIFECPGVLVKWTPGSVWNTYPYHQHSSKKMKLEWEPVSWNSEEGLCLRATSCEAREPASVKHVCRICAVLPSSARFRHFLQQNTGNAKPRTTLEYLNQQQLLAVALHTSEKFQKVSIKVGRYYTAIILNLIHKIFS